MDFQLAASVLLASIVIGPAPAADLPRPAILQIMVYGGESRDDKLILESHDENVRFYIPLSDASEEAPATRLFNAAIDGNRLLNISADWGAVELDSKTDELLIPICSAVFDEMSVSFAPSCPRPNSNLAPSYVAIARSIAEPNSATALRSLDLAIAGGGLSDSWRLRALETRASTYWGLAFLAESQPDQRDKYLVAALSDYAEVGKGPNGEMARLSLADTLSRLGAYDEARATANQVSASNDPSVQFQRAITTASIARLQGKPEEALEILNRQFTEDDSAGGMKFYYHRGRTLMMLGRYHEAVVDFTSGFETQPEYASAYIMRGCAEASLGNFVRAQEDFRAGDAIYAKSVQSDDIRHERVSLANMMLLADSRVREATNEADPEICRTFIAELDSTRERSKLLP